MCKKLTHEEFLEQLKERNLNEYNNITFVEKYVNAYTPLKAKCKYGDVIVTPSNLLKGSELTIMSAVDKTSYWIEIVKDRNKKFNDYDYSDVDYVNGTTKVNIRCKIHDFTFKQEPREHIRSITACPKCNLERNSSSQINSNQYFIDFANRVHGEGKYDYSKVKYTGVKNKVIIGCNVHVGYWFKQRAGQHINAKSGCPRCRESRGELEVRKFLLKYNINFIPQKRFEELGLMEFDFYFKFNNREIIIEFDGKQHEKMVPYFHKTIDGFEESKRRDELKNEYCKNNNIEMHRIKYNQFNDIEDIVCSIFKLDKIIE